MKYLLRVQVVFLHPCIFMLTVPAIRSPAPLVTMPRKIEGIVGTLLLARQKDAKPGKIKKNKDQVKFKVQCNRNLYTLAIPAKRRQPSDTVPAPRFGGERAETKLVH